MEKVLSVYSHPYHTCLREMYKYAMYLSYRCFSIPAIFFNLELSLSGSEMNK